jgi:poly-gamma-glutamate capsule biosynthesis protein CapA/YwtB (metallophosphatase superfamily)
MQTAPMTDIAAGGASSVASAASDAALGSEKARLVFGSLEGQLRAQGTAAAALQSAAPSASAAGGIVFSAGGAAAPAVPGVAPARVSFNNTGIHSTLISVQQHAHDATAAPTKVVSEAVRAGMASGHINVSGLSADTFALSGATLAAKAAQEAVLRELEVAKRARSVVVPTTDSGVRRRLREIGEPITLFGEKVSRWHELTMQPLRCLHPSFQCHTELLRQILCM